MNDKILEVLLDMQRDIKEMKSEIKEVNLRLDKLEYKVTDGFETLDIKIDDVDLKLRKSNKRLSEQIALNMEGLEKLRQ